MAPSIPDIVNWFPKSCCLAGRLYVNTVKRGRFHCCRCETQYSIPDCITRIFCRVLRFVWMQFTLIASLNLLVHHSSINLGQDLNGRKWSAALNSYVDDPPMSTTPVLVDESSKISPAKSSKTKPATASWTYVIVSGIYTNQTGK